ncbi:hypothetical protein FQN57_001923 [Myotisia sp. PD_48]|nr:hypothetical protein FQN57_001923 [Myotisia sp. PD_48]
MANPPIFKQFSNFTTSGPGIENILRLLQFTCLVAGSLASSPSEWKIAGAQFSLGRRYFRYFKFIDCFNQAWNVFMVQDPARDIVASTLEFGKWNTLGIYLMLEAVTILDALGVRSTSWGSRILLESNKFWFYSLALSLLGTLWQIFLFATGPPTVLKPVNVPNGQATVEEKHAAKRLQSNENPKSSTEKGKGKGKEMVTETKGSQSKMKVSSAGRILMRDFIVGSCDLLIPGYIVGWVPISPITMGSAAVLSTLIVGRERWAKAQQG